MSFVEIQSLSRSFGAVQALKELSFSVEEGERFGLIGPDGAGKTTLFRILVTLLLAGSGTARIDGLDVVRDYKKIRRITGYMPGRFSLYHDLTVEENLQFYATVFGTSVKKNYDLIKSVYARIEPFKNRLAGKLSGGMKQKLALSCALIHRPRFLVLDEPTTGVDAVSRKEFWEMLEELKKYGITVLVSTPYMDEAILCDRVVLLQEGQLLRKDTPEGIIRSFKGNLYALKGENIYARLARLRSLPEVRQAFMFGQEIHLSFFDVPTDTEAWKETYFGKEEGRYSLKPIPAGIEDCFVELMTRNLTVHDD